MDCLARINLTDTKLPLIDLGLRPTLENMEQIARQTISGLRQAHETRLLQDILRQSVSITTINANNLLILKDEAVKSLSVANEHKLLQNLAKSGSPLALANLQELSRHASAVKCDLVLAHDIKLVADLAKELCGLGPPNLGRLNEESKRVFHGLRMAADYRQLEQLKLMPPALEVPALQIFASKGKMTYHSLKKAKGFMILRQLDRHITLFDLPNMSKLMAWSHFILKKLKSAHQTRIMNKIYQAERERAKIIKNCYFHAEWAGSDLHRWDRVFAEYEKSPKKLKILNELIDEAHSKFALILSNTQNLDEIQQRCENDPFLQYEYGILKDKVEQYYNEKREKEMEQTEVEKPKFEDGKSEEPHKPSLNFHP